MVPASLKIPTPFEYAFPKGALYRGVQPAIDFDKRGKVDDDQARDKETGQRIWTVTLLDLDPDAARFGRDLVKVKLIAESKKKTDRIDAQLLAHLLRIGGLPEPVHVPSQGFSISGIRAARTRVPRGWGLRASTAES